MKKFRIISLLLITFVLSVNIAYAATKEFVYKRDIMPDYLFSINDSLQGSTGLLEKLKKLRDETYKIFPKVYGRATDAGYITDSVRSAKCIWDDRVFTENINERDAKYWLRMQVQDRHNVTNVEIKHIETRMIREKVSNSLFNGKIIEANEIKLYLRNEEYAKFFPNGSDAYSTTRKIEWVVFEITYKPEQVTNIRTNVNVNNGNEPVHGFVVSERL